MYRIVFYSYKRIKIWKNFVKFGNSKEFCKKKKFSLILCKNKMKFSNYLRKYMISFAWHLKTNLKFRGNFSKNRLNQTFHRISEIWWSSFTNQMLKWIETICSVPHAIIKMHSNTKFTSRICRMSCKQTVSVTHPDWIPKKLNDTRRPVSIISSI